MVDKLEAGERWQHVKRGTSYEVLGTALLQDAAGNGIQEGHPLVIYRGDDGLIWARGASEFVDGRFVKVAATPANGEQVERALLDELATYLPSIRVFLTSRQRAHEAGIQWHDELTAKVNAAREARHV